MGEEQDEGDVRVARGADPEAEPNDVGGDAPREQGPGDPPAEPLVEADGPGAHGDHDEVHREEPEGAEGEGGRGREHPAQERRVPPEPGARRPPDVGQVERDLDDEPSPQERERRPEEPGHAGPDERPRRLPRRRNER